MRYFRIRGGAVSTLLSAAAVLLLSTAVALAAGRATASPSEIIFLGELLLLMLAGRLLGEAMQRIGQPSIMGMLFAGIVLGPSVLGALWPDLQHTIFPTSKEQKAMLDAVSQFGILLLLLLTGMETDLKLVQKVGRAAISVALSGVALPFACGVALGLLLPQSLLPDAGKRVATALFLGTALSISSIKIIAAIVREMNFTRRNLGQIIVSSAILEDTIGWIIIAVIFSLAQTGEIDLASVATSVLGTALFLIASFTIGRRLVFFLIRWSNDTFQTEFPVITTILVIMGGMALITHLIGVHSVLGAFTAGVLIGESPILTRHIDEQLRGLIVAFFMPVFFGLAGLSTDFTILKDPHLLLLAAGLIAIASIGKFAGAFVGGAIGGLHRREALALACGMNARGSTEVIVATIGLSMGALTQDLFTIIVAMAFVTTMAMPPMLRWALARVPMTEAEKERLEREEFEEKGFVSNIERILLAADDSPNGKFAARLAGMIAGPHGVPTTVLRLSDDGNPARRAGSERTSTTKTTAASEDTVRAAADSARGKDETAGPPSPIPITVRDRKETAGEAVASEAKKGYDLLFVGMKSMRAKSGGFSKEVSRIAQAFEGPTALAIGRDTGLDLQRFPAGILVPVAGTDVSRRAAELAIAVARACECPLTALYVASTGGSDTRRSRAAREQERAITKEVITIADHYDVEVRTVTNWRVAPDKAIIAAARTGKQDLIIMGVSRRPGERLFFGDTASAVLEHAPASIMFLAT